MLYVGNDIVDLHADKTAGKSSDSRFVKKVLTEAEKLCFDRAEPRDVYLWSLWAAKETAYKVLVKVHPGIASWPRSYEVTHGGPGLSKSGDAMVKTPLDSVQVILFVNNDYIHCIGAMTGRFCPDMIIRGVVEIDSAGSESTDPKQDSEMVRQAAVASIAACEDVAESDIEIRRARSSRGLGPPIVYIRKRAAGIDLSLSHHGRFAAFAFSRKKKK